MTLSFARSSTGIGAQLAVATIPLHLLLTKTQSEQFAAVLLAVIGAIYIGFGLQQGSRRQIATELTAAIVFIVAALAAIWSALWIIPFAYVVHGIWDHAHHQGLKLASLYSKFVSIPAWYPPFCAVYDWVAVVSLAVIWSLRV
ncbi:MAG TPA: DUF6010 family protein [Methylocella sp.]|nr:DUF6010 family protein [Methylocella sp.]